MIEGIDYYPKKRKKAKNRIWLTFVVLSLSATFYYLYEQGKMPSQPSTSSRQIVVSEPTVVKEIPLEVSDTKPKLGDNDRSEAPRIESLDKVIETYQQQQ